METFSHKLPLQLRFNDVDIMGHVNNAVIMEFFDYGKMKYFDDADVYVEKEPLTLVIVHYEVDFLGQILRGDHPEVWTKVVRFGNKSLEVLQYIVCDGEVKSICKTIMSGYNREKQISEIIPERIKMAIERYEYETQNN